MFLIYYPTFPQVNLISCFITEVECLEFDSNTFIITVGYAKFYLKRFLISNSSCKMSWNSSPFFFITMEVGLFAFNVRWNSCFIPDERCLYHYTSTLSTKFLIFPDNFFPKKPMRYLRFTKLGCLCNVNFEVHFR